MELRTSDSAWKKIQKKNLDGRLRVAEVSKVFSASGNVEAERSLRNK
jgi:hypothetical protein